MNQDKIKEELSKILKKDNIPFVGIATKEDELNFKVKLIVNNDMLEQDKIKVRYMLYDYLMHKIMVERNIKNFEISIITQEEFEDNKIKPKTNE